MEIASTPTPPPPTPPRSVARNADYDEEFKINSSSINVSNPSNTPPPPPRRSTRLRTKTVPSYAEVAATPEPSSSPSPEMGSVRKPGYNNVSIFDIPNDDFGNTAQPLPLHPEAEVCGFAKSLCEKFVVCSIGV